MLANDLRRLAEEIAGAYEERVQSISDLKRETAEKLGIFRSDLETSNKERALKVHSELKEMGNNLRSDLNDFSEQLSGFKRDLDQSEKDRKKDAQEEIHDRSSYISGLRNDTTTLISDFENARKDMWRSMKSQLEDFTSTLAQYRNDVVDGNRERMDRARAELKDLRDNLRSQLGGCMSTLKQFKTDLDKSEINRKEEGLAEINDRGQDVQNILGGTQDMLKAFGNARKVMRTELKGQLDAFTAELSRFKGYLDRAELERQETTGREISERREHIGNLKGDTRNLVNDFENARKQMWGSLKSELEAFTSGLAQFKTDLEKGDRQRLDTVVKEMREKGEALKANLQDFSTNLSTNVGQMLGELKKDRSEAARAWHEILSAVRSATGGMTLTTPEEPVAAEKPETKMNVAEETVAESEGTETETPEPQIETQAEADLEETQGKEAVSKDLPESPEDDIDTQDLYGEIVSLLQDTPDGLRMVEIAEHLRIENWRSLIPVMRELMDDGDVKKEDSIYFVV